MSKIIPISIIILVLFFSSATLVIAQGSQDTTDHASIAFTPSDMATIIGYVFYGVIGSILAIIFTPILREWFQKRQAYLKPYTEWCVIFAGILHEFGEICERFRNDGPKTHIIRTEYNPTDILTHLWQMHQEIETGYKWLIMVKKDNHNAGESLDRIMDGVDRLWHELEYNQHGYLLRKATTHEDFKKIIASMRTGNPFLIEGIAIYIRLIIKNSDLNFAYNLFEKTECYLYKKTPRRLRQTRTPSCSELFPPCCRYCQKTREIKYLTTCIKCGKNTCKKCRDDQKVDNVLSKEFCSQNCSDEYLDEKYDEKNSWAKWKIRRKLWIITLKRKIGYGIYWFLQ